MPVWIKNRMSISEWGTVQFRLSVMQQEMKSSLHVAMLVRTRLDEPLDEVYIVLPEASLTTRFPGFIEIRESDIPSGLSLLVGEPADFQKRFPEIAAGFSPTGPD